MKPRITNLLVSRYALNLCCKCLGLLKNDFLLVYSDLKSRHEQFGVLIDLRLSTVNILIVRHTILYFAFLNISSKRTQ